MICVLCHSASDEWRRCESFGLLVEARLPRHSPILLLGFTLNSYQSHHTFLSRGIHRRRENTFPLDSFRLGLCAETPIS